MSNNGLGFYQYLSEHHRTCALIPTMAVNAAMRWANDLVIASMSYIVMIMLLFFVVVFGH